MRVAKIRSIEDRVEGFQLSIRCHTSVFTGEALLPTSLSLEGGRNKLVFENDHIVEIPSQQERSEEHTSELQSRLHLVCRLLLEKKKKKKRKRLHKNTSRHMTETEMEYTNNIQST